MKSNRKAIIFAALFLAFALLLFLTRSQQNDTAPSDKISGAYEAMHYWHYARAYPEAAIPDAGHYRAFQKARREMPAYKSRSMDEWEAIGPINMGGRTLTLAFNPQNPNTVYAGSASGGLWRSYSGGRGAAAWEYVATGFPVLGVSSIAIVPNDSNTIYIGTGEVYNYQNVGQDAANRRMRGSYGIGILKSTDGGATWQKSLDWSYQQRRGVWSVKIDPQNSDIIWTTTTEGTYKSTDAGNNWIQVHNVIMGMDLEILPNDPNSVFVSYGNFRSSGFGIYRTTDGGGSWTKLTNGLPSNFAGKAMLAVHNGFTATIFASIGNGFGDNNPPNASWLCKSIDLGNTWTIESTVDYSKWQGWYSHDVAVNPTDPTEVYAVGIDIWKSTGGGNNLQQMSVGGPFRGRIPPEGPEGPPNYSHSDHHGVFYHPSDPTIIYFAHDGGVNRTLDGGLSYQSCIGGYQTSQFYGGFSTSPVDSNFAAGGFQDNSTAIYDGRPDWRVRLIGGDGGWTAVNATNRDIYYGSAQFLNIFETINDGQSWQSLGVPNQTGGVTAFIAPFLVAEDNPNILYAGRDLVYRSINRGNGWTATGGGSRLDNGNPVAVMALSPQNNQVVYAATAPFFGPLGVYRTINGNTWTNISNGLPNRFPGDLFVDPNNEALVYLSLMGFGSSHLYKSVDYGSTWQDIDNGQLPDVPASAVLVDPANPDHIYLGNDLGVYVSLNGGNSWQVFSEGLPDAVIVMDLALSPMNNKLRIATHGNGAFQRDLIDNAVAIDPPTQNAAASFTLMQNFPNPFNPSTTITFRINEAGPVKLQIYDILGQQVRTLLNDHMSPGEYFVEWDGRRNDGQQAASGSYIYTMTAKDLVRSKQMQLIR